MLNHNPPPKVHHPSALAARVPIDFVVREENERATFRKSGVVDGSMIQGLIQIDDDPELEIEVLRSLLQSGIRYEPA
jgi:hypothetical protein